MESVQGEVLAAVSLGLYEYESAIGSIAAAAKEAEGLTLLILQGHLKSVCEAHLLALLEQKERYAKEPNSHSERRDKLHDQGTRA